MMDDRILNNLRELGDVLEEIADKVHGGDWRDLEDKAYWQGKKDGLRLAISLLHPSLPAAWISSLESSPGAIFLPSEEALMEKAKEQRWEQRERERREAKRDE